MVLNTTPAERLKGEVHSIFTVRTVWGEVFVAPGIKSTLVSVTTVSLVEENAKPQFSYPDSLENGSLAFLGSALKAFQELSVALIFAFHRRSAFSALEKEE